MSGNGPRFALVERKGYSERELFEGDELEEMYEFLEMKTGDDDRDRSNESLWGEGGGLL